ncbi:hypothetical protein L6164_020460 [Bauhinia variegata]|uniref:Uncharacterized protein n=1 Tax=Bauhinia variegata TaxID=167791 RepID=A0ACB9MX69_BAUVA|nr:hypothetical protein L6164_020460 [Bauhinia variegata]
MMVDANISDEPKPHLIFVYGTLKKGFPNHALMEDLISTDDAVLVGKYFTQHPYPLVCGPYGIPYLINLPRSGHRITGELYSVSSRGLERLDELEGIRIGHYERLPIRAADGAVSVDAEAYFAHRTFGEGLWRKKGHVGISEYEEKHAREYVRIQDRPSGSSVLDAVIGFVSCTGN